MAKEEKNEKVEITQAEYEELKSGKSELRELVQGLAQAIQESRKPYVSEGQIQNEEAARQTMKAQAEKQRLAKKWDQEHCPHIKGCNPLSDSMDMHNRSAFIRHRLDTGATFLMCSNCQRIIWQDEPDFQYWATKPSGNRPSAAGDRFQPDPLRAMREGRLEQPVK